MAEPRIHPSAIVEPGVQIGDGSAIWDGVHLRHGARIGRDCIVGEKTYVAYDVRIGDRCKLNAAVYVCAGVTIGDGCMIAAQVVFTNDRFPRAATPDLSELLGSAVDEHTRCTTVEDGATIGANATIGPGLTIGRYAMVGMGAVVTRSVPAHGLVVGNPAKLVGLVARDGTPVWRAAADGRLPPDGSEVRCADDGRLRVTGDRVVWMP